MLKHSLQLWLFLHAQTSVDRKQKNEGSVTTASLATPKLGLVLNGNTGDLCPMRSMGDAPIQPQGLSVFDGLLGLGTLLFVYGTFDA